MHQTPLDTRHRALGARMVEFGGWEMPVLYGGDGGGIVSEHRATRSAAGIFDLCHMGRFFLRGPGAATALQGLLSFDVAGMREGQARYGFLLDEQGRTLDDVILYRLHRKQAPERQHWLLVVNAANRARDLAWIAGHLVQGCSLEDASFTWGMIAVQGPLAETIVGSLLRMDLSSLPYYACKVHANTERWMAHEDPIDGLIARTGYTGEDGFEIYLPSEEVGPLWDALLEHGRPHGLVPVGLGARDTLRLEAAMPLYGHELDATTTPLEAGLGFAVSWDREFIGKEALARQKEEGVGRRLVGFEVLGSKKVARQGHGIFQGGQQLGAVTSGSFSPTLERNIGLAYVRTGQHEPGTELEADVRGAKVGIRIVKRPFYKRAK